MTSVHIPFFLDGSAVRDFQGSMCVDGSLLFFLRGYVPCPHPPASSFIDTFPTRHLVSIPGVPRRLLPKPFLQPFFPLISPATLPLPLGVVTEQQTKQRTVELRGG